MLCSHASRILVCSFAISILFTLASCDKQPLYEKEERGEINAGGQIMSRNTDPDTVIRIAPDFHRLKELAGLIENNVSTEQYLQVIDYYGEIHWGQAHTMGFAEDTSTYAISVPLIKNDKVEAVLLNIKEECEFSLAPHLVAQINNLSLLFPCQIATADQIMSNVMQNLCNSTGPNEFISMLDVEEALANYAYVDMSLLWSDPEEFEYKYIKAVCECSDSQDDCESSIVPYSCQSFEFEDLGLFQIARLRDVEMNFYNTQNNTEAECKFNVQVSAPLNIELNLQRTKDMKEITMELLKQKRSEMY